MFLRKYKFVNMAFLLTELRVLNVPQHDPPVKSTIWYNVRKYKRHGTSLDRHKGNSGRDRTITSQET